MKRGLVLFNRKRYWPWILFAVLLLSAVTLSVVSAFPNPSASWLSRPGVGDSNEADSYYSTITAPANFTAWKTAYGFTGSNDVKAIYYNAGDLGFGREMHCRKGGSGNNYTVACYVINHGLGASTPVDFALNAAISNTSSLPVVAMAYSHTIEGQANDVSFYIYNSSGGGRLNGVTLDSEGDKFAPQMCLACHGGYYDLFSHSVFNANFLPFDVGSFKYSQQTGYTLADQQEKFRQLNSMVRDTIPTALIAELINGWYGAPNGVITPGATPNTNFVPPGYVSDPGLYNTVFKPYCRSCHIAQTGYTLSNPTQLLTWDINDNNRNSGYDMFHVFEMPHAELTSHNFWNSPAPAYLADRGGWSYRVTRLDDPTPNGCQPTDCTLREAILAANLGGNAPVYKGIITFGVDGVFTLTRSGADDTANAGDLDITGETIILGNGAGKTIIDGGGIDRVFHIVGGAIVVIQGVTIQHGSVSGNGGGIYNDGSQLTLNASVLKNNTSSAAGNAGAGLANLNNAITIINASLIGLGNSANSGDGGGIVNDSTLTLNNSTISGNTAQRGAGIDNVSPATANLNQSTVTGNTASGAGGGVRNSGGTFSLQNSIVAGNAGASSKDCNGTYTSQGYNLVGQNGSANGCPTGGTNIVLAGAISAALNTQLTTVGAEQVPYHALVMGSLAVDAIPLGGNCSLPSYDQRNAARPLDGNFNGTPACDVGAYELVPQRFIFLPLVVK